MKKSMIWILLLGMSPLWAADKLKDFRGTNQTLALIGLVTEFVEPAVEEATLQQLRRKFSRYSKTYGDSSIQSFTLGGNPGKQYFRPAPATFGEAQKKFLQTTSKDNSVDILVLGSLRQIGEEMEIELQLYDSRIDVSSKIEKAILKPGDATALEAVVYRVMNYLDREGYVYNTPQDFLEPPLSLQQGSLGGFPAKSIQEEFSINPSELGSGTLAGEVSVGGDKAPFWERWWFWTIIGGSLFLAGGLSYYFLVVDQPPTKADVTFTLP